jgi:hypothetical protein
MSALRIRRYALAAAAASACLLAATAASAALYKWTDANGRVVYSDQPPTGGIKYETVGAAPPPANPNAARDLAQQDLEMKKRQAERVEADEKAAKARADAAKRAEVCTQARGRVRQLSGSDQVVLYRFNDKGERVVMSAEDRRRELDEQRKLEREYCAGR